nr:sialidase-like isoform X2 [Coffea arabica]
MAQLEVSRKYAETPTPKTPKAQSLTFEQLLQDDEASWQHSTSPTLARNHYHDEDLSPHNNKKSVLTKVKERARKLRQSFSGKKKHDDENHETPDGNTTPPWGVSLDDSYDDEEDEDAEYLGAPMYESELAPEIYRETARQHPRADPVVSEKHLFPTSIKHEDGDEGKDKAAAVSKTITETVSEKLAPAYAKVSDATQLIASKIAGLTISSPEDQEKHANPDTEHLPADDVKNIDRSSEIREHLGNWSPQKWDKGVSVKEYFMNKIEPGEDDRALSQAISEAISPRKSPRDMGMVEKVREAVTSFLRHDEHPHSASKGSVAEPSTEKIKGTNFSQNVPVSTTKTEASPPQPNLKSLGESTVEKLHRDPSKATSLSSNNPVSPPNSLSSVNVNSSPVTMSPRAISREEPSKETIKPANLSLNLPNSTKKGVPPPNSNSSTSAHTPSHAPISPGANFMEQPRNERAKAANLSPQVPLFIRTEVPPLNSISSTNASSLSHVSSPRGASSKGKPSRETMKAEYLISHNPLWIKTEVPSPTSTSSANVNPSSYFPLFRSTSLTPQVPVFHSASSSPLVPVSTNAQEDLEEQTHGRILQAN